MYEQLNLFDEQIDSNKTKKIDYNQFLKIWDITDETVTAYITYLSFKYWLYYNFPQFIDKEVETDNWEIVIGKNKINVRIGVYTSEPPIRQYVSVGYQHMAGSYHGWGCPCDTLKEVKDKINQALNETE